MESLQESFWRGQFGNDYIDRNSNESTIISNTALFARMLRHTGNIQSICELGANIGLNLVALHSLLPDAVLTGVEINQKAADCLSQLPYVNVKCCSIYDVCPPSADKRCDFVFTKGVLIHQNPELLSTAYDILYQNSRRYIMLCEYYNPTPVEVEYRGHTSVLYKRDFAGEMMTKYSDLLLLDYGFVYHGDNHFKGDDFTWFLMEKDRS